MVAVQSCFSHLGANKPGVGGAGCDGRLGLLGTVEPPGGRAERLSVCVCEMPDPGRLSVCVTRPLEWTESLAPRGPALTPMPLGVTVILTPGANLKLFLILKPTATASSLRVAPADTPRCAS